MKKSTTCSSRIFLVKFQITDALLVYITLKLCWKDINKEFDEKLHVFRRHAKNIEEEAGILGMIEAHEGWAVAERERKRTSLF